MSIKVEKWATMADGSTVYMFEIMNRRGLTVKIINYGGIITSILTPDRKGVFDDIVLGYDDIESYIADNAFLGAMVGRFANRIRGSEFTLNGKKYSLTVNEGTNHLHGGSGFHKKLWDWTISGDELILHLKSLDGEDGYPGNLEVKATVSLDDGDKLLIDFMAISDKDTIVNLTNHAYFNLAGGGSILGHKLKIKAERYTPADHTLIPTGELRLVEGTVFDFRKPRTIDNDFYDNNFVLGGETGPAAVVFEPESGRVLRLTTNMPGLQFYCGGNIGRREGKYGAVYLKNSGFCLEPQYFPNTPNEPKFPSCVLKAGDIYNHKIAYEFTTSLKSE